jgi:aminopeptidase N
MWVHESFANYAENLYEECQSGKADGARYVIGTRKLVTNDRPIIGHYGVNSEGSGDMYYKGGNMLHTIRQIVNDDAKWRSILRGINSTFRHQTVTGRQIEQYINQRSGIDFDMVFAQYLMTTLIPVFEYRLNGSRLSYRWTNVVPGFDMPVRVTLSDNRYTLIHPTQTWKTATAHLSRPDAFHVDENFYVNVRNAGAPVTSAPAAKSGGSR